MKYSPVPFTPYTVTLFEVPTMATIHLMVGPLGNDWSVKRGGAYYGRYPSRKEAEQAANEEAEELRAEGHEVTVRTNPKKPTRDWT